MVDNSRKTSLRQMAGKWYFQTVIRRHINRFFVPGQSAKDLLRYFGVPENEIHEGLYGADSEIFFPGPPLAGRSSDFAFVGQFVPRKGISCLIDAVRRLRAAGKQFSFAAIGEGPLRQKLLEGGFQVEPFSRSEAVAALLRKTRFLILPSREEHWGVVVHEAALSGCGLILSETVGSCPEFAGNRNSWRFRPGDSNALAGAMRQALDLDEQRQQECRAESLALAKHFGPSRWNESFKEILAVSLSAQEHEASVPVISAK
jgi:glycosyltransferase involved in cell wall biosynthesis